MLWNDKEIFGLRKLGLSYEIQSGYFHIVLKKKKTRVTFKNKNNIDSFNPPK